MDFASKYNVAIIAKVYTVHTWPSFLPCWPQGLQPGQHLPAQDQLQYLHSVPQLERRIIKLEQYGKQLLLLQECKQSIPLLLKRPVDA
jgi:hypothetical protein